MFRRARIEFQLICFDRKHYVSRQICWKMTMNHARARFSMHIIRGLLIFIIITFHYANADARSRMSVRSLCAMVSYLINTPDDDFHHRAMQHATQFCFDLNCCTLVLNSFHFMRMTLHQCDSKTYFSFRFALLVFRSRVLGIHVAVRHSYSNSLFRILISRRCWMSDKIENCSTASRGFWWYWISFYFYLRLRIFECAYVAHWRTSHQ